MPVRLHLSVLGSSRKQVMLISRHEVNGSATEPRERTESKNAKARVRDRWRC
jgi:hypothetical protein